MIVYNKIYEFLENKEREKFNRLIDFTKISDNLSNDNIKELCKEAETNNFYSICVLPKYVSAVYSFLNDETKISSLVGFPKGDDNIKNKINEIDETIINGANEIDVVINYKLIKNPEYHEDLQEEIRKLSEYCHREGVVIKTIIEVGVLNYQEIEEICKMCVNANVDFVMTSTGKLPNDDSFETKLEKVKFMRKILPDDIRIKFSGGIRNYNQIKELSSFVDRIGTSIIIS